MLNFITRIFTYAILSAALLIVAGCGATSSSDDPELNEFEIIDTGGSDSENVSQSELLVDADEETPETNEGEFTLYWDVDTNDDYQIDIYINVDDRISGARKIFSDFCDPDDDCHEDQTLECDFQNDLDLVCEDFDDNEIEINIDGDLGVSSGDLPEDLYFILEVCDPFGFDCEDQSLEVRFDD